MSSLAEEADFDFAVISDHYSPWLEAQGHSPYAWSRPRGRCPGDRTDSADDLRDLPDDPLPPGRRRAEGGDDAAAVGRPLHARARRGREPERARRRSGLAGGRTCATRCSSEAVEIIRALLGRRRTSPTAASISRSNPPRSGISRTSASPIGIAVSGRQSCDLAGRARRRDDRRGARGRRSEPCSTTAGGAREAAGRPGSGVLRPERGGRGEAGSRAVPLVRRRLEGERRAARSDCLRCRVADWSVSRTWPSRSRTVAMSTGT